MLLPGFPIPILGGANKPLIIASTTAGQSNSTSGVRSVSVSYPIGTQPGDLVVALATASGNGTLSDLAPRVVIPPEGWAPVVSAGARGIQTTGTGIAWQSAMRVAQSGDAGFTWQARSAHRLNVTLVTIRGAALPLDAVSHGIATAGGTLAGLTVSAQLATLLMMGGFSNANSTEPSITGPSGSIELLNYTQNSGHNGGLVNWMGYQYDVPAGGTGNKVWTEDSASNILAMLSLTYGSAGAWLYDSDVFTTSGSFEVPIDVTEVNILCVGAGGRNWPGTSGGQGGGGACAWSNGVAVTPGEALTVNVGQSLTWNTHNTDDCASYVKRGGTTLVLADYGRPATPTASPGVGIPGAGGLTTNSVGDSRVAGISGDNATNRGGQCGTPFGYMSAPPTNSRGIGLGVSGVYLTQVVGAAGGGANQHSSSDLDGSRGIVIISWGRNRGFGLTGGQRFI